MGNEQTTTSNTREEMKKVARAISINLRWFVEDSEQHLSGLECEYLTQAAQFLENLNER